VPSPLNVMSPTTPFSSLSYIATNDLVHLDGEVVAHHAADVRSHAVTHALYAGGSCSVVCEVAVEHGSAPRHKP
jgi:hypothetical protein